MGKVTTYLNFPRNTEEAFTFYKSVFGGEFTGGIKRFSSVPQSDEMPPMAEEDKNLVKHVVLPILGGHELMSTDAPESMASRSTWATTFISTWSLIHLQKSCVYQSAFGRRNSGDGTAGYVLRRILREL